MSVMISDCRQVQSLGYAPIASHSVKQGLTEKALAELELVEQTFENLVQDSQMGDGGRYRFRRYSRFRLGIDRGGAPSLQPLDGSSIHQSIEDNPLNGGVTRTFEPLDHGLVKSSFLRELVLQDARVVLELDTELGSASVVVGVHQVRIVATQVEAGKPAPEGVHRDAERFTFQHFWDRRAVEGGEFIAYDANRKEVFRWLQTQRLDSVLFRGSTWHSATPICCRPGFERGHRDIFLVDFDTF